MIQVSILRTIMIYIKASSSIHYSIYIAEQIGHVLYKKPSAQSLYTINITDKFNQKALQLPRPCSPVGFWHLASRSRCCWGYGQP